MIQNVTTLLASHRLASRAKFASGILSSCVILTGSLILFGWALDVEELKRIFPGLVAMNPLTAVSFIAAGVSIILARDLSRHFSSRAGGILAFLVIVVGLLRLFEYIAPIGLRIDQIFFQAKLAGNVMAPNTALAFVLTGMALLFSLSQNAKLQYFSQALAIAVFLISLFALVGYVYRVQPLYKVSFYIPMALHTALAFSMLSLATLNNWPQQGFMQLFISSSAGGFIARRLLPAAIVIPLVLGQLRLMGERAGLYTTEFGVSLLVIANIVVFFVLVWWTARIINRADTERRKAEEALQKAHDELEVRVQERTAQLKQAQQQLVQQERLRALGQMAGGIAHDFNNALSPILGYSELLIDAPDLRANTNKLMENLKTINMAAKDAAKIVSRLREFFRPREKEDTLSAIDLNKLSQQVVTLTQPKWKTQGMMHGRGISMKIELNEIPMIEGNESELREVLTNLVFNAADAMPEGGEITLGTQSQNKHVLLRVRDTGTGMTEEVRRRCLEPFFSTKGDRGTGLGLAMVYGIIQRHNGSIDIESELGCGTTFIMRFPVQKQEQREMTAAGSVIRLNNLRILCVDDEPLARNVTVEYLKRDGHSVEIASNGPEGLDKFKANGPFDLVITDRAMPGMTGDKMSVYIKKINPEQPVILLSGTADFDHPDKLPDGIDALVSKPVTIAKLRETILRVISHR